MHSYTLKLFIVIKTKLRQRKKPKLVHQRCKSYKISEKCELSIFIIFVVLELLLLITIIVFHAISEQLMIEFLEEEYLVYGCLFISLLFTANSTEKRLFKANLIQESELDSKTMNDAKLTMKKNLMENFSIANNFV